MGLVVRMGEGKSRWWWKSLNRRTICMAVALTVQSLLRK